MQRFSFPLLSLGTDLTIADSSFVHQVSHVLRSKVGESIILFNGDTYDYLYQIQAMTKKDVILNFMEKHKNMTDSPTSIHLYQAIPNKYEKIEYILQKGTEVWVKEFVFFRSERSQRLVINERKIERFREIVREATEQCGWNQVPKITFHENSIPIPENGASYTLHTHDEESKHIRDILTASFPINIFIWPEGGWSDKEMMYFKEKNIQQIHLWSRILRTETTGVVVAFFLMQK